MTFHGENGETRIVLRILSTIQSMLEDSRKDVGRLWGLEARRNGVEPTLTNWMENGIKLLKAWCSTSLKADILCFVPPVPLKEESWKAKKKEISPFILTEGEETVQSAQYLRIIRRFMQRMSTTLKKTSRRWGLENYGGTDRISPKEKERSPFTSTEGEETVEVILRTVISVRQLSIYGAAADLCNRLAKVSPSAGKLAKFSNSRNETEGEICEIFGDTDWDCQCKHRISELNIIGTGRLVARIRTEIRRTSWWSEIVETVLRSCFLKGSWQRTILHYTWRRRTQWYADGMWRVHTTSRSGNIPSERVDSWKNENRPSLGCKGLPSSRTLLYWQHDRKINVESIRYFEAKKHPEWEGGFSETCSNLQFETEQFQMFASWMESTNTWPKRHKKFPLNALSMDVQGNLLRRQSRNQSLLRHCLPFLFLFVEETGKTSSSREIPSRLFHSFNSHDQIDYCDTTSQFFEKIMEQ